ncbi:hypothetical protein CFBP6625_06900 [Agrobacterium tumefaciens]|nr:hypothetical protein CFBP6625_06900 [Agrobacterium tumefaciens]
MCGELAPSSDPSGHLLPDGEKKHAATRLFPAHTNETVIGTRRVFFRYRSWKEACHAAEFL